LQGKKLDAGLQLGMAGPAYNLSLGDLMPKLGKFAMDVGQYPNTLKQQKQGQDAQLLAMLLGLPNPTGSETDSTSTSNVNNTTNSSSTTNQNQTTKQDNSMGLGGILSQAAILTALLGPQAVQGALAQGVGAFKKLWENTFGANMGNDPTNTGGADPGIGFDPDPGVDDPGVPNFFGDPNDTFNFDDALGIY
jgi:hypothetical protein